MEIYKQLNFHDLLESEKTNQNVCLDNLFTEYFIDQLSRLEVYNKHLFRPNTYLHKWWARRCGSIFRAILKQFVENTNLRDYYAPGGLNGKIVLDPMMGGGTTIHEAIRLGANVIGADIDPIPVIQARASLTKIDLQELKDSFNQFHSKLDKKLKNYFQTSCPVCEKSADIRYTLYGSRKSCMCGEVVQIDQFDLRHEPDQIIRINPITWEIFSHKYSSVHLTDKSKLITKKDKRCATCKQKYQELVHLPFYARYVPIAIVGFCDKHGLFFRAPSESDIDKIVQADERRSSLDFGSKENFMIKNGLKSSDLLRHNIDSYLDLFSSRQLIYLFESIQELSNYNGIVKLNLGLLVSTSLEFNSMLCGYKGWQKRRSGAIRHVFSLHAYSLPYTALENNPINQSKTSGNLKSLFFDRINRGRQWAENPIERKLNKDGKSKLVNIIGEKDNGVEISKYEDLMNGQQKFLLIHGDSRYLPIPSESVDLIVTDPPYYDSIQYSNLASFFRVWLSLLLPFESEWNYDESGSAVSLGKNDNQRNFLTVMSGIFAESKRVLKQKTGRMVFTFHHWNPNAWAELSIALRNSQFKLISSFVVVSEHPISVHIRDLKSLKHDSILIFSLIDQAPSPKWSPVDNISSDSSSDFCRQCNLALGWLLETNFSDDKIFDIWKKLIKV